MEFAEYKPRRNEPCWCGSGAKYKKCHLAFDEEKAREHRELEREAETYRDPVAEKLFGDVMDCAARLNPREDLQRAARIYFDDDPQELRPDSQEEDGFVEWYIHEFRGVTTGRTPIEDYLAEAGPTLSPRERQMLEAWRDAKYSLFEVESVEKGAGVHLHDLLDQTRIFLPDPIMSKQARRWDCLLVRLDFFEDKWSVWGNLTIVPRAILREILEYIEAKGLQSHVLHRLAEEFWGDWAADLEIAEMDESPPETCNAEFPYADEGAILAELRKAEELVEAEGGFSWLTGAADSVVRHPLGKIALQDGLLTLTTQSPARLEIGRELLARYLPNF